jgi:hypothetical protein
MLADGEKILFLRTMPLTYSIGNTTSTSLSGLDGERVLFYAVVVAGHALASVNPPGGGGGVIACDLGEVNLGEEGTRWVRDWNVAGRDALLAVNKLQESDDAAE